MGLAAGESDDSCVGKFHDRLPNRNTTMIGAVQQTNLAMIFALPSFPN
jgi:hypothetical protein